MPTTSHSSQSKSKPTLLLVPGAWQTPWHYGPLHHALTHLPEPYKVASLSLPSNSAQGPWNSSWKDDITYIQRWIHDEAALGNEVILLLHSYAGCVGSEACKGYLAGDFSTRVQRGGVRGIVYITAVALPAGSSIPTPIKTNPDFSLDAETGSTSHARPGDVLYPDIQDPEVQEQAIQRMVRQSHSVLEFESTFSPWEKVRCLYIVCEEDVSIPPAVQRQMAEQKGQWNVESVRAGHSPALIVPDEVAGLIDRFVRSVVDGEVVA